MSSEGRKTERGYWEAISSRPIRLRLPSRLNVSVLNLTRLLKKFVHPGDRYLEIGCAPGKILAWVSSELKARVAGLDYSEAGIAQCRALFTALQLEAELHCADLFSHGIPAESFDVVASFGVVEHFNDPRPAVQKHIDLVRPGGLALIAIPNYGGLYGILQNWCDKGNLALHNLDIMTPKGLTSLVDPAEAEVARAFAFGAMAPGLVSLDRRLPPAMASLLALSVNVIGLLQPFTLTQIAPLLVLEIRKTKLK